MKWFEEAGAQKECGSCDGQAGRYKQHSIERSGSGWVCKDDKGVVVENYSGVAYNADEGYYVSTWCEQGRRGFRVLGSGSLAGALEEHDVLSRQTSLDL